MTRTIGVVCIMELVVGSLCSGLGLRASRGALMERPEEQLSSSMSFGSNRNTHTDTDGSEPLGDKPPPAFLFAFSCFFASSLVQPLACGSPLLSPVFFPRSVHSSVHPSHHLLLLSISLSRTFSALGACPRHIFTLCFLSRSSSFPFSLFSVAIYRPHLFFEGLCLWR